MFGYNKRAGHRCGPEMHGIGRGRHGGFGHGFGGRHGWGEGGRGDGRSRRMFDGGELRLVLLKLIADEPRHGYDLIRQIEELTGGAYAPSPGVVYPTITLLDDMGLVEGKQEGAKKLFAITEAGTAHLAENAEAVAALFARLAAVGEERSRTDHRSIRRAMMNLGIALRDRLSDRDLDDETLQAVVALIDDAAQKIERL